MNILARTGWDLVLRVTLCYMVFYATIYFLMILINGLSVAQILLGQNPQNYGLQGNGVLWLKFTCEIGARLLTAALLVHFGVPRYRFARLQEGHLYTHFTNVFPQWIVPMVVLACITFLGQQLPIANVPLFWLVFHFMFAFAVIHYMMHGVAEPKKMRLLEES